MKEDQRNGTCDKYGEKRNVYRVLVEKHEGLRVLGIPRHRWKDDINIYLKETTWSGMGWINLAQDREKWQVIVNAVMNLWVP
jgi:hypothetical protein